jgi:hypothetical protein
MTIGIELFKKWPDFVPEIRPNRTLAGFAKSGQSCKHPGLADDAKLRSLRSFTFTSVRCVDNALRNVILAFMDVNIVNARFAM